MSGRSAAKTPPKHIQATARAVFRARHFWIISSMARRLQKQPRQPAPSPKANINRDGKKRNLSKQRLTYWGGPPLGVQMLQTSPTPKTDIKQIEQFILLFFPRVWPMSHCGSVLTIKKIEQFILRILRFLAESSRVTKSPLQMEFQQVYRLRTFFPSNAFMASARSLHMFNRSKKMNCSYHARLSTCR